MVFKIHNVKVKLMSPLTSYAGDLGSSVPVSPCVVERLHFQNRRSSLGRSICGACVNYVLFSFVQ